MTSSPTNPSAVLIQRRTEKAAVPRGERSNAARRQSAAVGTSLARYGVRAVDTGNETQRFMAKPCTPHLHSAGRAVLRAKNCQCAGSRGKAPRLSLGGFKGGYSLRKESIPLCPAVALSAALSIQRSALQPPIPRKEGNQKGYPLRKESIPLGFPFPAPVPDYFLKLSFSVTDRLNTRCSAVQSLLSRQKYPRRMNWKPGAVLPFFSVLS